MHAAVEDWKNGWIGLQLAVEPAEIDKLIELLLALKQDPDQHFHISSDYKATGGLGDIEVFARHPSQPHNLFIGGLALVPGDEINAQ